MNMKDALPRIPIAVHDKSEASGRYPPNFRHRVCDREEMSYDVMVLLRYVQRSADMLYGDYEHVHRSLRVDILKGNRMLVPVDYRGRRVAADDTAEDAPLDCHHPLRKKYAAELHYHMQYWGV